MFSSVQTGNHDMNKGRTNINIRLTERKVFIKCAAPIIINENLEGKPKQSEKTSPNDSFSPQIPRDLIWNRTFATVGNHKNKNYNIHCFTEYMNLL
jgi:hypothetical protein